MTLIACWIRFWYDATEIGSHCHPATAAGPA
jgi:hypothetical protein